MSDSESHDPEQPPTGRQHDDPRSTTIADTQQQAGIDRAGTGHGSAPNTVEPAQHDAPQPSSERPVDQAGPVGPDGSQQPPTDRTADPSTWEADAQGDVSPHGVAQDDDASSDPT